MSKRNKENFIKKNSDLGIKVGDWFRDKDALLDAPTLYYVSSIGTNVVFTYIHLSGSRIETGFRKVCGNNELKQSGSDLILTDLNSSKTTTLVPISEKSAFIILKCCNRDLCYILECFNLQLQSQPVSSGETKLEKLKKSRYLKYVKNNEVYYLHSPKYQIKKIQGQEKFCVIASGITIINNRINHHSCNGDELNLIRLMFDNEEEFFNKVTEIGEYEYHTLWHDLI